MFHGIDNAASGIVRSKTGENCDTLTYRILVGQEIAPPYAEAPERVLELYSALAVPEKAPRGSMFNSGLRTTEPASESLLRAVEGKGRTINYALPGSDELRYLDYMRANAHVGGPKMTDILLRQNPMKVEVLEEFLHGTQYRIGVIDSLGVEEAEIHVKELMHHHQRLLGISPEDAKILQQMLGR